MDNNEFITLGMNGYSCDYCGTDIGANDPVQICADCGAIFCKECVISGNRDEHECMEDELL